MTGNDALGVDGDTGGRSLLVRVGAAMSAIAVMGIVSMLASIIIAQTATGDAEAINKAGSLRMQAYRLAEALRSDVSESQLTRYTEQFSRTLDHPALRRIIPSRSQNALWSRYSSLRERWRDELAAAATSGDPRQQQAYLKAVPEFVGEIDELVAALEAAAADRIQLLRFSQGAALFITIALIFFTLYRLVTEVLPGVRELLRVVAAAQHGDLTQRTHYRGHDEIGALARTFNGMADNLQAMYRELEERVAAQTARLSQSNNALQLLYDVARLAETGPPSPADWSAILAGIEDRLRTGTVALYLLDEASATTCLTRHGFCEPDEETAIITREARRPGRFRHTRRTADGGVRIPLFAGDTNHGVLAIAGADGALNDWQRRSVETVAGHIATARARQHQETERRRLALMEERNAIARELHDSLAQALSYLKIQTARLDHAVAQGEDTVTINAITAELRDGLNNAYRQLRELINTFRLQPEGGGLRGALANAADDFGERGDIKVTVDWRAGEDLLSPNEELHVVQIVREALANVIQHAQPTTANITVDADGNSLIITVSDDGCGLPAAADTGQHHGLTIMRERAQALGGELDIEPEPSGGTRVILRFQPAALAGETTADE